MGPKPHPTPKPHARSVIAKINKVIEAKPKSIPIRPPPPRSLRTVSGIIQPSSSSTSRTQVRPPLSEGPTQCESGDQGEFSIDFDTLEVPACFKLPLVGQILPADPAPLKDKTDAERLTQNQRILDLLKEFSDISTVAHQLEQSKFPDLHMQHLIRSIEPETVKRHLNKFLHFVHWLKFDGGITMEDVQPFHIADYLMDTAPSKKNAEWRFKPAIGSLT